MKSSDQSEKHKYTNKLVNESSPYLLQHAHNPVDWYPWGDEALNKAKEEDKLIIISVGYAACHWCHVMEHESFEDSIVAQIMNEHFVNVKVDREERPDVDDVYMTACQLASGRSCGWPLNAFALPDGRPVWAGTYFPKNQWMNILDQFIKMKEEDRSRLEDSAERITEGIKTQSTVAINTSDVNYTREELDQIASDFKDQIDFTYGGRKGSPKFPMPNNYEFMLKYNHLSDDPKAMEAAKTTLDNMAKGGIYDQLGGGFARYSTDSYWLAPHFEKMLYDNGQLLSLYAHAYMVTKDPLYEKVVRETIAFANRELSSDEGGFFSSLDADSEGEEGKFYVFQKAEIDSIIGDENKAQIFNEYFSVTSSGNWEHKNILMYSKDADKIAQKYNMSESDLQELLSDCKDKLFEYRSTRVRPGLDDKVLTSWNGLMLNGLIDAYRALDDEAFLERAYKNADFLIKNQIQQDGRVNRNYKDGISSINGFLDDYATVIEAFIALYQIDLDDKWLNQAKSLTDYAIGHFYNQDNGMFNYTSNLDPPLVARKSELADNVIPASTSMMARNLHYLSLYFYDQDYEGKAKQMMHNMIDQIKEGRQPSFYSNWCQLYLDLVSPPYEIAVVGKDAVKKARSLQSHYLPNAIVLGSEGEGTLQLLKDKYQEGETLIYVCQNKVCKFPVDEVEEALALMR